MRASTIYLAGTAVLALSVAGLALHAAGRAADAAGQVERKRTLVRQLSLTDLCLFSEANYTRHPSMTDLTTPFQDSPASFEHFPSGGLVPPPPHLAGGAP